MNKRAENMMEEEEEVADVRRHFNRTRLIFGITPVEPSFSTSGVEGGGWRVREPEEMPSHLLIA